MIDANSQFFAILTNVGMAKQANADALGLPWKFTDMGVGDANNTDPIPSATQTALINEWRRRPLNQVRVDPVNPAVIIAEQIIPADEGGHWIREIGLYDADGDLVAVANCAPSFKPVLSQGSGRTQVVRMNFIVASTGNITLKINPAVVLATREYVDTRIMEELYKLDSKQSVRVATTANIALAGLQTIDGVALVAGDRVLVKNQNVAKDNGIYLAAAAVWNRSPDADTNAEVTSALLTSVEQGATLADTRWQLVTDGVIVLGTTALTFQNVTQGFAPINSPALISPTANTPAQFDSSLLLINSEFLKRRGVEFGDYTSYAASAVLTVADCGKVAAFAGAGAMTATLPTGGAIPRGAVVKLLCGLGTLTVTAAAGDTIDAVNAPGNISMVLGDTAEFIRIGTLWRLIGGSVALKYASVMSGPNWTTQPLFANDKSLATTEFVQRALGNANGIQAVNAAIAIPVSWAGQVIGFSNTAPITVTLPPLISVPNGTMFRFIGMTNTLSGATIMPAGGDSMSISGSAIMAASLAVNIGDTIDIIKFGSSWQAFGGSLQLGYSSGFRSYLADNGWEKLPSGRILQWGRSVIEGGASALITYPIAFPIQAFWAMAGIDDGTNSTTAASATTSGVTQTTLTVRNRSATSDICWWMAIGK